MNRRDLHPPALVFLELLWLWLAALVPVEIAYVLLLKLLVGPPPHWLTLAPVLASGPVLGFSLRQGTEADGRSFLDYLGVLGTIFAAALALAGVIRATGGL